MLADRVRSLRARVRSEGADAIALVDVPNLAYCTGFRRVFDAEPAHVALVSADEAVLITDSRYLDALQCAAVGTPWSVRLAERDLVESAMRALPSGVRTLALETSLPHARYLAFAEGFLGDAVEASGWVEELRQIKDAEEIASISAAQELTDRAFEHVVGIVAAGVSERDIALEIEFFMRRQGSEGVAFPPIVASGPNSAMPHASVTERELAAGDFVVLDFGARVDGYCADMTRTLVVGKATDRHRDVYEAVLAANVEGIDGARAGLLGKDVDAAARAVIAERGFGERFGHGLGHGVGLEVHELPSVGPRSEKPLLAGMVVTVEPGVYLPQFGGVRIEDLIVVEASGARVLTRSTKDLIEV